MRNHPLYQRLLQIALDGGYTIEQVQNVSISQVAELLGTSHFSFTFLKNMKIGIINVLQNQNDERDLQDLRQQARSWLDANFPDWEAERDREGDKPFVTIWLRGKP